MDKPSKASKDNFKLAPARLMGRVLEGTDFGIRFPDQFLGRNLLVKGNYQLSPFDVTPVVFTV